MSDKFIQAQVESITPLTDSILQLVLTPDEYIDYQAGQYLQIISNQEALSYSIANAPLGSHKYELHIRHHRDNPNNLPLLAEIKNKGEVTLRVPLGECNLSKLDPQKPIIFIAGGTGFAPIKAMIEQLLANGTPPMFELFWGARAKNELYMDDKLSYWQNHVRHFHYFSQCSDTHQGTLASLVIEKHPDDLRDWQVVISGPFDMVYDMRDKLIAKGALRDQLFSDAFSFEGEA